MKCLRSGLVWIFVFASSGCADADELSGRANVIDGDTIEIHGRKIRIEGVDAPEPAQRCRTFEGKEWGCGQKAALALADQVGRKTVRCEELGKDQYERTLAACAVGRQDIGAWLVSNGWAIAYRRYSERYTGEEQSAREARVGIWSGEFVEPWRWRKGDRLPASAASASIDTIKCRIKGNISKSGRIYHVPGSRSYDKTRIDESKGERWFCSVDEARAAGWRAPGR